MMVDVNRNLDLVLGFKAAETAQNLSDQGEITVDTEMLGELVLPCGPLIPHGVINHKRYLVRAKITPGVPQYRIAEELAHYCKKVREVEMPNMVLGQSGHSVPVQQGSMECYLEFDTTEDALNLTCAIKVDGYSVQLRHKGLYECKKCKEKGHTEKFHDVCEKQKKKNAKRHEKRSKRR